MNNTTKYITTFLGILCLLVSQQVKAQVRQVDVPIRQVDDRIYVRLFHDHSSSAFGGISQDYRVTIENRTQDKLLVKLEYSAHLSCGIRRSTLIGPFNEGMTLKPGETIGKPYATGGDAMAVRLTNQCPQDSWIHMGKNGSLSMYSMISSMEYRLISIENISEKERKEAEEKKQKEEAAKKEKERKEAEEKKQKEEAAKKEKERKEAEEKKQKETAAKKEDETKKKESETTDTASGGTSSFWTNSGSTTTSKQTQTNSNFKAESQFHGGLGDIKEGGYFSDGKGTYFKKVNGGAEVVSKSDYDRAQTSKVIESKQKQITDHQQYMATVNKAVDNTMGYFSTTFYAQQLDSGIKDATNLGSNFNSIEELNSAFSQRLSQINSMSQEYRSTLVQNMNYVTSSRSEGLSEGYASALNSFGTLAANIAANKREKDAREELSRQRAEAKKEIEARQLRALIKMRNEIKSIFPEGGMPLSSHKVNVPVLYVFAYSSNESLWNANNTVAFQLSNVIPVYRYSDGSYPYTSNVKRTFENGGLKSPVMVGYFTDRAQAESYRSSLADVAPNAQFSLKEVEIKVKEKSTSQVQNTASNVDFWGVKKADSETKQETNTEVDFWGNPVEKNKTETQKTETTKNNDFWSR